MSEQTVTGALVTGGDVGITLCTRCKRDFIGTHECPHVARAEGRAEAFRACAEEAERYARATANTRVETHMRAFKDWCDAQAKAQEPK